jgi:hypothetical protein
MALDIKYIEEQVNRALMLFAQRATESKHQDLSGISRVDISELNTILSSTVERLAPTNSRYIQDERRLVKDNQITNGFIAAPLAGILKALLSDYKAGYTKKIEDIVSGDVFSDFLEMAEYFLDNKYKDAAAVMAGGVLEESLRKLCLKYDIDINDEKGKPKRADRLNADLTKVEAYSKMDQASVLSWLKLRNHAAHGEYNKYTLEQVALILQGVRDFVARQLS